MEDVIVQPLDILQVQVGSEFEDFRLNDDGSFVSSGFEDLSVSIESGFENAIAGSYEMLKDKPRIEGLVLSGDRSFSDFGLSEVTNTSLQKIYNDIVRS